MARNTKKATASAAEVQPGEDGYEPATAKLYADTAKDRGDRAPGVQGVAQLDGDAEVAARTGPDAQADGKFRHTFTLSGRDFEANESNDDMHRANQAATLQFALNKGVHPKGEAALESTETTHDGSVRLTYAVKAIPAGEDEVPSDTQTPTKAIRDMGGSTVEHAQNSRQYGTKPRDEQ